jgi:hypothetical protein
MDPRLDMGPRADIDPHADIDARAEMDLDQTPDDRGEQLRREAEVNAAQSAQLARHIRTFAQQASPERGDEHWTPALPFDPKT